MGTKVTDRTNFLRLFFMLTLFISIMNFTSAGFGYGNIEETVKITTINNYTINGTNAVHNDLTGLQGGDVGEYYHLPQSEYDSVLANYASFGFWDLNYSSFLTHNAYALNATPWTLNWSNFSTLYANQLGNYTAGETLWNANYSDYLQTKNYALNNSLWSLNYSDYLTIRSYALNDSLWGLNYTNFTTLYSNQYTNWTNATAYSNSLTWLANYSNFLTISAWNDTGLIQDWNSTGYIANWNASGLIKDFNSSGLIKDWNSSGLIANWNNASLMTYANWNSTNTSYFDLNKANVVGAFNQTFDTSTLFVDSVSDRVGIGTTSPEARLHLRSSGLISATTSAFIVASNSGGAHLFSVRDDGQFSFYGTDTLEKVRISNSGNVGIGTTSPGAKLEVSGEDNIINILRPTVRMWSLRVNSAGSFSLYDNNGAGELNRLLINTDGNVGIGTASPEGKLSIQSPSSSATTGASRALEIREAGGNDLWSFRENSDASLTLDRTADNGANWYDVMHWDIDNGNVGIGTTSPEGDLVVSNGGAEGIEFFTGDPNYIQAYNRSGGTYEDLALKVTSAVAGTDFIIKATTGNVGIGTTSPDAVLTVYGSTAAGWNSGLQLIREGGYISNINSHPSGLLFRTMNSSMDIWFRNSSDITNLFINGSTGNVGIGTTTPQNKLNVNGIGNFTLGLTTQNATGYSGYCTNTTYFGGIAISCND